MEDLDKQKWIFWLALASRLPLLHWFLRTCIFQQSCNFLWSTPQCYLFKAARIGRQYRPHVGPASSVNMKKSKWQLLVAPLIYGIIYLHRYSSVTGLCLFCSSFDKTSHLCCLSCPALCITLTCRLLGAAGDGCVAHTAVKWVSPQGTCSGTWIQLACHPALPAPRLTSRVQLKRGAKAPELPIRAAASLCGPGAK